MHRFTLPARRRCTSGFTLIELLVTISIVVLILAVGVPGFQNLIIDQRLKSVNSQLLTDLQLARAEAASRNMPVYVSYRAVSGTETCYTLYTTTTPGLFCNCTFGAGNACQNPAQKEIKTVSIPWDTSVRLFASNLNAAFDNVTGGLVWGTTDFSPNAPWTWSINTQVIGDATRNLRIVVPPSGRPAACSTGAKLISGYETSCI